MSHSYDAARLRRQLAVVHLRPFFRVVAKRHEANPLGAVPAPSRFSDPAGVYAVLYAAASPRCAFWEAVARGRFTGKKRRRLPLGELTERVLVTLHTASPLRLLDLRGDGCVRIGAPTAAAHDANHAAGRALSAALHALAPEADGVLYASRFIGEACAAVFDRAFARLQAVRTTPLARSADVLQALEDYDITLETPPEPDAES